MEDIEDLPLFVEGHFLIGLLWNGTHNSRNSPTLLFVWLICQFMVIVEARSHCVAQAYLKLSFLLSGIIENELLNPALVPIPKQD